MIKKNSYYLKKNLQKKKIRVFNSFKDLKSSLIKKKIDYIMCSISGLAGLDSTINSISITRNIAIANKESIICAWSLIEKKLIKHKTKFIPVDSEHFSIWSLLDKNNRNNIEKIIITASGGPFLKLPLSKFNRIKPKNAIKHPVWKMGNKISIDSATLMNKVFEVIEAQRIFNIEIDKFTILIHPKSYVHAIIKFNNGLAKILVHDSDMRIPIFNSIYNNNNIKMKNYNLNINILNNLNFSKVNLNRFPCIKILNKIPKKISLYETVLVSANDQLVGFFLKNKISFQNITFYLKKIMRMKVFLKYKKRSPKNYNEIIKLSNYVRLKTKLLCI